MAFITLYDVTGIQDFIFSSNVLKENVGASKFISSIFRKILPDILTQTCNDANVNLDSDFEFFNSHISAEVVYIGGGNASVIFREKKDMVEFNKSFTKKIFDLSSGKLHIAFSYLETSMENFVNDFTELHKMIQKDKNSRLPSFTQKGIAITKEGVSDGEPAIKMKDGEPISKISQLKEENVESHKEYPLSIDRLAGAKGESYIAVVHVDGNNMGKIIEKILMNKKDYSNAIIALRNISSDIDKIYNGAFKNAISKLKNALQANLNDKIKFYDRDSLPIRPIVQDGDDITFIINSKIALEFTKDILSHIDGKSISNNASNVLSASAGIAFVKPHFPFYKAYKMAEQLCSNAKLKAKSINNDLNPGSWIDFHIQQNALLNDLNTLRKDEYNLADMDNAEIIEGNVSYANYNLLWRPWQYNSENEENDLEKLFSMINTINKKIKNREFPKNKIKNLRLALSKSNFEAKFLIEEMKSRKYELPMFLNNTDLFKNNKNMTPYIDVIELLDFYISY